VVLLTDWGAALYLKFLSGQESFATIEQLECWLLVGPPPMDKTLIHIDSYPIATDECDPVRFFLETADSSEPEIVNGRAVIQWGPPAYQATALEEWTCYGTLLHSNAKERVISVERFDTPRLFTTGQVLQLLPSVTMTSECPPLGGCS